MCADSTKQIRQDLWRNRRRKVDTPEAPCTRVALPRLSRSVPNLFGSQKDRFPKRISGESGRGRARVGWISAVAGLRALQSRKREALTAFGRCGRNSE